MPSNGRPEIYMYAILQEFITQRNKKFDSAQIFPKSTYENSH